MSDRSKKVRTALIWLALATTVLVILNVDRGPQVQEPFSTFLEEVELGEVAEVRWGQGNELTVIRHDGHTYSTVGVLSEEDYNALYEKVIVTWDDGGWWRKLLIPVLVLVILLTLFAFLLKKAQKGTMMNAMQLRKSRARLIEGDELKKVRFADVGGLEAAKERLSDVIDFLAHPKQWEASGARLPRGVLLEGPPGCGKTLLARAVAGEAGVPFYLVSASEFVEMFVGIGAARVRDMFEEARQNAPAVIFIDELDAVGRRRGSGMSSAGHDEREQTLNQLLVSMDGFEKDGALVVMAATNRADILDGALLRPGRFDLRIEVPLPTRDQRLEILGVHCRNKPVGDDVSLDSLADQTAGFHGADLENLCNEAALAAIRRSRKAGGGQISLAAADFTPVLEERRAKQRRFDQLDSAIIESATQLTRPTGRAIVQMVLEDESTVEGEVVWSDAAFIKLKKSDGTHLIVSKRRIVTLEALEGTDEAHTDEVGADAWAHHVPDAG